MLNNQILFLIYNDNKLETDYYTNYTKKRRQVFQFYKKEWLSDQGIIDLTEMEAFAKEPSSQNIAGAKVGARAVSVKNSTGFCRMSTTASLWFF